MIQYLSVARSNLRKKNNSIRTDLPYQLKNISELSEPSITIQDKLVILLEQSILARTILNMTPTNQGIISYLEKLNTLVSTILPVTIDTMDNTLYQSYVRILKGTIVGDKHYLFDAMTILNDNRHFNSDAKMLPKAFYEPYLILAGNRANTKMEDYISPVLALPSVRKVDGGIALHFTLETFTKCQLGKQLKFSQLSPLMEMILKLDWSAKYVERFIDTMSRYGAIPQNKFDQNRHISGMLFNSLAGKSHRSNINKSQVVRFQQYLQYICTEQSAIIGSYESLYTLFSNLGYIGLEFLISPNPTNRELAAFEKYPELSFLKTAKLQAAMEATSETTEDATADDVDDDPETDPNEPEDTDTESADTADTDTAAADDFGMDDDEETDDTSDAGSGGDDTSTETDTLPETEDPFGTIFKIVHAETPSEHFQREAIVRMLQKLINNPTSTVSGSTVNFLKMWLSQWVNLVSVETTQAILSQLAISIDV